MIGKIKELSESCLHVRNDGDSHLVWLRPPGLDYISTPNAQVRDLTSDIEAFYQDILDVLMEDL